MIQTIEGRLGGGKTMLAMEWICNHWSKGGVVATNINVQLEPFSDQYGDKKGCRHVMEKRHSWTLQDNQLIRLSDERTVDYPTRKGITQLNEIVMFYKLVPRGTPEMPLLVIIDEAHLHFPQSSYKDIPPEVLHFLTLSRHACVDVVFISQHIKNMWCQMTRLTQFRWSVKDLQKYGVQLDLISVPWIWPHFLQLKFDETGQELIKRKFALKEKLLYHGYKSPEVASKFESMDVAASVQVESKGMTLKEKIRVFGLGAASGCALAVLYGCVTTEQPEKKQPEPVEQVAAVPKPALMEYTEPEYYKGHYDAGYDSKFFTTERTYYIGDNYDGFPIVECAANRLTTYDAEAKRLIRHHFPSEPKQSKEGSDRPANS